VKNVTEVMVERLTNAGLEVPQEGHPVHTAVGTLASGIDAVLPTVADDPFSLRVVAQTLRSYADVAEEYAVAREAS
jgi:hypothetical protein